MSTHTPGPWAWWTSNSTKRLSAGGKDGGVLYGYRAASDGMADVHVREADMALIAAAPDMLDALLTAEAELEQHMGAPGVAEHVMPAVRTAIAKARGDESSGRDG